MSEPIGVGDWVECVDGAPGYVISVFPLRVGQIYCVDAVADEGVPCASGCGTSMSLSFDGRIFSCAHRFRPIYRPNRELIEGLKTPLIISVDKAAGKDVGTRVTAALDGLGRIHIIDVEDDVEISS